MNVLPRRGEYSLAKRRFGVGALRKLKTYLHLPPPSWVRDARNRMVWRIETDDPVLFLTFDDGPSPGITPWILEQLERFQAKATFFCVGTNVVKHPHLYASILESGHATGNHTFSHLDSNRCSIGRYVWDVHRASRVIDSRLFRPPFGRIRLLSSRVLMARFQIVLWDVLSEDYDEKLTSSVISENVLSKARPGSVVVFHDSVQAFSHLQHVLPLVLDHYAGRGYEFLPLCDEGPTKL